MGIVKRADARAIRLGGQSHSGWLPKGAAVPLPTPEVVVSLEFAVHEDAPGSYILEWQGPSPEHCGDSWHSSLEDALRVAEEAFGIARHDWRDVHESPE
jgi:hypothetical protein